MKFVTYNIRFSLGKDHQKDLTRIADAVKGADVIALQEVERFWKRSGMTDQPVEIGKLLPDYYWIYGPAFDMDASQKLPDGTVINRRRQFGTMLLTKTPIVSSCLHTLPKLASNSHFNMNLGALEGVINTSSQPLRVYSLHLSHLSCRERILQLKRLLDIHRGCQFEGGAWSGPAKIGTTDWSAGQPMPPMPTETVIMGDFNCQDDSSEYELMVGSIDNKQGRVSYGDVFVDTWEAAGNANQQLITWTHDPAASGKGAARLDYCFVTPGLAPLVREAWADMDAQGSDHQPYWVQMDL